MVLLSSDLALTWVDGLRNRAVTCTVGAELEMPFRLVTSLGECSLTACGRIVTVEPDHGGRPVELGSRRLTSALRDSVKWDTGNLRSPYAVRKLRGA